MTPRYLPGEESPHQHIVDQHRAAWHESQAADRIGWQPRTHRDVPPEEWIAGVHYDPVVEVDE